MTEDPRAYGKDTPGEPAAPGGETPQDVPELIEEPIEGVPIEEAPSEGTTGTPPPPAEGEEIGLPPDSPDMTDRPPKTPVQPGLNLPMVCATCIFARPIDDPQMVMGYHRVICKWRPPQLFMVGLMPKAAAAKPPKLKPGQKTIQPPPQKAPRIVQSRPVMPAWDDCGQWFQVSPDETAMRLTLLQKPKGQA